MTVLTQDPRGTASWRTDDGVEVRAYKLRIGGDTYPFAPGLLRELFVRGNVYDVIHAHSYHSVSSLAAAISHRKPFVFTPHYHGTGHSRVASALHVCYLPFGKSIFSRADRIICVSHAERTSLLRDHPSAAAKVAVVPNGIASPTDAVPDSWESRGNTIVYVGRLQPYKRLDLVIEAVSGIPQAELTVVGRGRDEGRLSGLIESLHVRDRVTMAGHLSDAALAALLAGARLIVSASEQEAFGIAILEGRQSGARVVASDVPAHAEVSAMDAAGGIELWNQRSGVCGLRLAIGAALAGTDPGPMSGLPRWSEVAAATEEIYLKAISAGFRESSAAKADFGGSW